MKTLEQLGISPAPWNVNEYNNIVTCYGHTLAATIISDAYGHDRTKKDACIIAAPELYEALRMYQEAFAEIRKSAWFLDANFHEIMSLNKVMTSAENRKRDEYNFTAPQWGAQERGNHGGNRLDA